MFLLTALICILTVHTILSLVILVGREDRAVGHA